MLAAAFWDSFKLSPLHVPDGSRLLPSFTALFKALDNIGDPPNRQRAITPKFLRYLHRLGSTGPPKACAIDHAVDLLIAGFFFATRPCEIVRTKNPGKTKTLELRDIIFRDRSRRIIPHDDPRLLDRVEFVTVTWRNQKNGKRGATMHHTARPSPFCPVKALANRVHHLYELAPANPELPISFVSLGSHVTSSHITLAVRESVVLSGLLNSGYSPSRVSAHSLHASGAMVLKLNGVDGNLIMKLGCWSSTTWLTYIQPQMILSRTAGL